MAKHVKVVRSQDVMNAIRGVLLPIKSKRMVVADIGLALYQELSNVQEFYADGLIEAKPAARKPEPRRYCAGCHAEITGTDREVGHCTQCGTEVK